MTQFTVVVRDRGTKFVSGPRVSKGWEPLVYTLLPVFEWVTYISLLPHLHIIGLAPLHDVGLHLC